MYLIPKYIKPTGLAFVPPEGPAIPVVDTDILFLPILVFYDDYQPYSYEQWGEQGE